MAKLAREVDLLDRLVQHQQVGVAQQRAGEQDTPELAAGKVAELAVDQGRRPHFLQHCDDIGAGAPPRHRQEAACGERQEILRLDPLRDIAHHDAGRVMNDARIRLDKAEQGAHGRGLAGPVRPDQAHHLTAANLDRDPIQNRATAEADDQVAAQGERRLFRNARRRAGQGVGGSVAQRGHSP